MKHRLLCSYMSWVDDVCRAAHVVIEHKSMLRPRNSLSNSRGFEIADTTKFFLVVEVSYRTPPPINGGAFNVKAELTFRVTRVPNWDNVLDEFNVGLWLAHRRRVLVPKERLVARSGVVHRSFENV